MIAECQEGILLLARGDGSRPDGSFFPAPDDWGTRTAAGGFALTGRLFFLHRLTGARELRERVRP